MFNKKETSKIHDQALPYVKSPVKMEPKVTVNFFGTKVRAFEEAKS